MLQKHTVHKRKFQVWHWSIKLKILETLLYFIQMHRNCLCFCCTKPGAVKKKINICPKSSFWSLLLFLRECSGLTWQRGRICLPRCRTNSFGKDMVQVWKRCSSLGAKYLRASCSHRHTLIISTDQRVKSMQFFLHFSLETLHNSIPSPTVS